MRQYHFGQRIVAAPNISEQRKAPQVPRVAGDKLGAQAIDVVHPNRDLHVTLLHLIGLDDNKLTYFLGGRFKQLSQFGGQVITS